MKTLKISLLLVAISCLAILSACDSDDNQPTAQELFLADISGEWSVESVTLDAVLVTGAFTNMTLTLNSDMTYVVTFPVDPVWPASGTFTLVEGGNGLFNMNRNDDVLITVSELSATRLVVKFPYTSPNDGGRLKNVSGQYEFVMEK